MSASVAKCQTLPINAGQPTFAPPFSVVECRTMSGTTQATEPHRRRTGSDSGLLWTSLSHEKTTWSPPPIDSVDPSEPTRRKTADHPSFRRPGLDWSCSVDCRRAALPGHDDPAGGRPAAPPRPGDRRRRRLPRLQDHERRDAHLQRDPLIHTKRLPIRPQRLQSRLAAQPADPPADVLRNHLATQPTTRSPGPPDRHREITRAARRHSCLFLPSRRSSGKQLPRRRT